jgi:manganese efflux pump family protein
MSVVGLVTGVLGAGCGLYLLSIWLIEYDKEFQSVAATRLPPPLLAGHVLAAATALVLWVAFMAWHANRLAWYTVIALVVAASLGTTMAIRWISVYRAKRASVKAAARFIAAPVPAEAQYNSPAAELGPPERNFPLSVVLAHGVFAVTTLTLVLLTALGVFGS